VRAHEDRSLTGQVAPVPDVDSMVGELVARVSGFGPLQPFLDDPAIDLSQPFVDAMLPEGHRLHVVVEGISHGFSAVKLAVHERVGGCGRSRAVSPSPDPCVAQPASSNNRSRLRRTQPGSSSQGK
jgi:hypothetical protein